MTFTVTLKKTGRDDLRLEKHTLSEVKSLIKAINVPIAGSIRGHQGPGGVYHAPRLELSNGVTMVVEKVD